MDCFSHVDGWELVKRTTQITVAITTFFDFFIPENLNLNSLNAYTIKKEIIKSTEPRTEHDRIWVIMKSNVCDCRCALTVHMSSFNKSVEKLVCLKAYEAYERKITNQEAFPKLWIKRMNELKCVDPEITSSHQASSNCLLSKSNKSPAINNQYLMGVNWKCCLSCSNLRFFSIVFLSP